MTEKASALAASLITAAAVARFLGRDQFGMLMYAQSICGLLVILCTLGLPQIVVKALQSEQCDHNVVMGTAVGLQFTGAIIAYVLMVWYALVCETNPTAILILLTTGTVFFFTPLQILDSFQLSRQRARCIAVPAIVGVITSTLFRLGLVALSAPVVVFGLTLAVTQLVRSIVRVLLYRRTHNPFCWLFSRPLSLALIPQAAPLAFSAAMIALYTQIDQIMIREMLGFSSSGDYAAANTISQACFYLPIAITTAAYPALVSDRFQAQSQFDRNLRSLYFTIFWTGLAVALSTTLASRVSINVIYDNQFPLAPGILDIHIWSIVPIGLSLVRSQWMIIQGMQIYAIPIAAVNATVNALANYALIPVYGTRGAAAATLLTHIASVFLVPLFVNTLRPSLKMSIQSPFLPN